MISTVLDDQIDEADQQLYKSKILINQAEKQIFNDGGEPDARLSAEFGQYAGSPGTRIAQSTNEYGNLGLTKNQRSGGGGVLHIDVNNHADEDITLTNELVRARDDSP